MKKISIVFLLLAAFFVANPAKAQFKWGLEGGVNLSKASLSKDVFDSSNRTGWFVGPKAQFTIPVIGLAVDGAVLYSQKYMKLEDEEGIGTSKTMPYLEIPINLKYNIGFSSLVGAYISTGPQYSWYLGGRGLSWGDVNTGNLVKGSLERSNFSWNVGVGINALNHLQLGVTYNIALGKTGQLDGLVDAIEVAEIKNNTWQVRLAYMF